MAQESDSHTSSTGHDLASGDWLDVHFEAERPMYEVQLRAVGIQAGWHVLDAGCGSGSFLPWLAELVGPAGRLAALDLAPENVALVERRVTSWNLCCPVETRVGSIFALPYPDDAFDALWFANTSQYLTDAELERTLVEFRRVVRPGGLVAIKEIETAMVQVFPAPPGLVLRWGQAAASTGHTVAAGGLRSPALPSWLRRAGFENVWQRSTLSQHTPPLAPMEQAFWTTFFDYFAAGATALDLPETDQEFWARYRDPAEVARFLSDPDCCFVDANILVVGTVPGNTDLAEVIANE